MNDLFQDLVNDGERLMAGRDRTFQFGDSKSFWLVSQGTVDLFSVPVRGGAAAGPRDHLCRVGKGNIFFTIPGMQGGENIAFQVVGGPETVVVEAPLSRLQKLAQEVEYAEDVRELLDAWVASLCLGLSYGRVSLNVNAWLEQGQDIKAEDDAVVSAKEGFVWAFQLEGSSRFLDQHDIGITQSGAIVPLCRYTWLRTEGPSLFHGESTLDLLAKGHRYWQALESFHLLASRVISVSRRRKAEEARRRLAQRRVEDQRITRQAYSELAAVLSDQPVASEEDSNAPLLAACRLVGRHVGLEIFPSRSATRHDDLLDHPLQQIAKASLFRIRVVLLKGEWWRDDNGPLLGFLEGNDHPVGLLQSRPGRYILHDPIEETQVTVDETIARKLSSSAYMIYKPFPPGPVTGMDILRLGIHGIKQDIWMILAMGVLAGLLSLIAPVATGHLYGTIIPSGEWSQLLEIVAALLIVAFATGSFGLVQALAQIRVVGRMGAAVEAALWDRLINLPAAFFKQYTAGDLANRALGIADIQRLVSGAAVASILSTIFLSFSMALLYYYGGLELFLAALAIISVSLTFAVGCSVLQLRFQRPLLDVMGRLRGLTFQLINGIAKLRISGAEKRAYAQWARDFARQKQLGLKTRTVTNLAIVVTSTIPLVSLALVFTVVVVWYDSDLRSITVGKFLAFNAAFSAIVASMFQTMAFVFPLLSIVPLYERTSPILKAVPETESEKPEAGALELGGSVEVSQVSFRYDPNGPQVLKNVSIRAKPGEFIALVGPSGSGKSTIFRLILGFETPDAGSIYFDGRDLRGLPVQPVRQRIGVVLQTGKLLPGSIFENIVGASRLTQKDAWIAARMAALDKDIEEMPMGMQTLVGEEGSGLSGGQKQRLLIARALVRRPRILLFDEATSALDNESQAVVSESLESLQATRIVIAHRLSTVKQADRIYVIVAGEVVESGDYDELMAKGGTFASLAHRQIV